MLVARYTQYTIKRNKRTRKKSTFHVRKGRTYLYSIKEIYRQAFFTKIQLIKNIFLISEKHLYLHTDMKKILDYF